MALNILFISYPSEDGIIADSISDAVKAMPENKLEVFLDRLYIKGGQHIPDNIQNALKKTSYFVAVGTDVARRNFDWCGLELGFYEGSHPAEARLETCLYHLTIPGLFAEKVCFKAESLKLEHRGEFGDPVVAPNGSEFFNFLNGVAELNALLHPPSNPSDYWFKVKSWAEQWAGQITDAFFNALQTRIKNTWYPQARLELVIKQGEFYKADFPTIPEDAEITLSASFYNIFALAVPTPIKKLSWSSFIELVKESTGSDILAKIVSDIVVSALPAKANAKNDFVFQAPNGMFYRVLLVMHSVYGNKRRDLVIYMVETREKVKGGEGKTTILVAGIVLGSKYRSIFLEKNAKYARDHLSALSVDDLAVQLSEMLYDIDSINADAASDGLADYSGLQDLLGSTERVKRIFKKYWDVYPPMKNAVVQFVSVPCPANQQNFLLAYDDFLAGIRVINTEFLRLCLDAYQKYL